MGLFGAGSLQPHWLPPIMALLSLGAKCSSRPDTNTRKRENVGESTSTFLGGPPCLAVAQLLPVSFLFPRTGWGTAHPTPLKPQGSCHFWVLLSWTLPTLMSSIHWWMLRKLLGELIL